MRMKLIPIIDLIFINLVLMCYGDVAVTESSTTRLPVSHSTEGDLWSVCPRTPQLCLFQGSKDTCQVDTDCPAGARCCYRGCARRCFLPRPCEKVICKEGYVCQATETACQSPPCHVEAVCVPETKVKCSPLNCPTSECQPGFKRAIDSKGCETCECVKKKDCGPECFIFCAYGKEEDEHGCPVCKCKKQPDDPCLSMSCDADQECRFVQVQCFKAPCPPAAVCVPKTLTSYENSCGLSDSTTLGLPVLQSDAMTELDCYVQSCPDATVCTKMGPVINRCCWQQTQEEVMAPAKEGQCPQDYMINYAEETKVRCEIDAQCLDKQKCCYRSRQSDSARFYGYCMRPIHQVLGDYPEDLCNRSRILTYVLRFSGYCT